MRQLEVFHATKLDGGGRYGDAGVGNRCLLKRPVAGAAINGNDGCGDACRGGRQGDELDEQHAGDAADPKAGKGEKVCRVKLKYSGEVKTWVCKAQEPCCVWHEINYVKCGSTITGCL